jgi:Zn finger protein HypA/HybF involved in hydrogenase expression
MKKIMSMAKTILSGKEKEVEIEEWDFSFCMSCGKDKENGEIFLCEKCGQ